MSSSKKPRLLAIPTWSPPGGVQVNRYPLIYGPATESEYNLARLPQPEAFRTMQLCVRELDDASFGRKRLLSEIFPIIFYVLAGAILAIWVSPFIPMGWYLGIVAAALIIASILKNLVDRNLTFLAIANSFAFHSVALPLFVFLGDLFNQRLFGSVLFGSAAILLFAKYGELPLKFFIEWLAAHPRLKPETKQALHLELKSGPNILLLVIVVGIAAFVPRISPTLAIGSIYAITIGHLLIVAKCGFRGVKHVYECWMTVFYPYFFYQAAAVPGIWRPSQPQNGREITVRFFILAVSLTLACALNLGVPTDLLLLIPGEWTNQEVIQIRSDPKFWINVMQHNLEFRADAHPSVTLLIPVALCVQLTLPVLVILAVFAKPVTTLLKMYWKIEGYKKADGSSVPGLDEDERSEWQWYVDRLRSSPHIAENTFGETVREAEHLFLGVHAQFRYPILIDRRILAEHTYIVGETGSGKTSLGIMPLLIQLIRGHNFITDDGKQSTTPVPPIVILDLKGDPALFHTIKEEVEKRATAEAKLKGVDEELAKRRAFRFFTPEKKKASYVFNPFANLTSENRSLAQLCNIFLDSLSLNHGEGYGRTYYSRRSRMLLHEALEKEPKPRTFRELYSRLKERSGSEDYREAFELVATIHALTEYTVLGVPGGHVTEDGLIQMSDVIEHGQVVYFWLPAALESISVREIGKMALFSLLTAAIDRQRSGGGFKQCYLVIDEFQRIAGENFKIILEQARSFGIAAILANQTLSDLRTQDSDLRPTVLANTRLKLFFSMSSPEEIKEFSQMSGFELAQLCSETSSAVIRTSSPGGTSRVQPAEVVRFSWSESMKNRITINDILVMNDSPTELILQVSRGSGYTQFGGLPIVVRTTWPIHLEEYRKMAALPWPPAEDSKLPVNAKSPIEVDRSRDQEMHAVMNELFEKHLAERPEFNT